MKQLEQAGWPAQPIKAENQADLSARVALPSEGLHAPLVVVLPERA